MLLLNRLTQFYRRFIAAQYTKSNPVGALGVWTGQETQPYEFDLPSHIKVYLVNVYAYACQRAIARDVSATPLLTQKRQTIDGQLQWVTTEEGDLYELFKRPNPEEPWTELCERWINALEGAGNGYLIYDSEDVELYHVRPDWVQVTVNEAGRLTGYKISNRGIRVTEDRDFIIHIKLVNPIGDYYGMPPSEVIKKTIMTKLSLNTYLDAYFKNNGLIGTVFSTEQALDDVLYKKIRKQLEKLYKGADKGGMIALLQKGLTASVLSHPLKDLIPDAIEQLIMREVCAAYGVPPIKIAILDEATYNNAKEQNKIYQHDTVEPIRRNVAANLNLSLVPHFGEDLRVVFDVTEVPGMQEDQNEKSKRTVEEWKATLITRNEAREEIGRDPVEDGGDEFFVQSVVGINPFDSQDGSGDDDSSKARPPLPRQKAIDNPRVALWNDYNKRLTKKETAYAKEINHYFDDQLDRLLAKIDEITGKGMMMARLGLYLKFQTKQDDDQLPRAAINDLFDITEENAFLVAKMGPVNRSVIHNAGDEAVDSLQTSLAFNSADPEFQAMVGQFTNRMKTINDTTFTEIQQLLTEGYDAGDSIETIERALRAQYTEFSKVRSTRIAQTEMNGMVNGGTELAYKQTGVEKKEWLATQDDVTRDTHFAADGQVVRVGESFAVGSATLAFPGDPGGPPEEVINCRCTVIPVIEDEQQ